MYEKQGTPPCGALNSYIWNKCIGEIADAIEDIALLRVIFLFLGLVIQDVRKAGYIAVRRAVFLYRTGASGRLQTCSCSGE